MLAVLRMRHAVDVPVQRLSALGCPLHLLPHVFAVIYAVFLRHVNSIVGLLAKKALSRD